MSRIIPGNILLVLLLIATCVPAQLLQNQYSNPVLNMRDGSVERYRGYYFAIGEGTKGKIYTSKDLVNWYEPVLAVTTDEATWLNDSQWPNAAHYKNIQAGDIIYRNGVFHTYWNGIGHAYASTPLGPYKEGSLTEPFDDYGIDVQVFQDEDGEIYWVKKRNGGDPHPLTGAKSNIDGPEVWTLKMNSPFSRWDITTGSVQLTHQPGHPTSVNMHNFEGPELFKYRGRYYLLFASNRMGPRSGMYEIGVAESDLPMNFDNTKKYPHPVVERNTERHLLTYGIILHSAEHGGWAARHTTTVPASGWTDLNFDDGSWVMSSGGYGRQEYDNFAGVRFTEAKVRARKTVWTNPKIHIRRKFTLEKVPEKIALKHWVFADANFYINGHKITINARNNTYSTQQLDPSLFQTGENIIAVEAVSPCADETCQQFLDFGLYDTGTSEAEDIVIGPAQPNFVTGPNGFEKWMMYKAYFNNSQVQGIDRIHFYNKELVTEPSTVKHSVGYRPKPAEPTMIDYFDSPVDYPYVFLDGSEWKISEGVLSPEHTSGGALLFRREAETNYRIEVPFRIQKSDGWAGAYAFYQDAENWLKIQIGREGKWKAEFCVNGVSEMRVKNLPDKFAFLENNPLVTHFDEPWHTLVIYKNGGRFKVELDYFNLTLDGAIETNFSGAGIVGLTASSNQVSFDAIQYTTGWDEYDSIITGWQNATGEWSVTDHGLLQTDIAGKAETFKGDLAWNYEFSTYVKNNQLPSSGKAGFYPLYVDNHNYVRATINYASKTLDIEGKLKGNTIESQSVSLKKQVSRYYTYSNYPTTSYQFDFRNESLVSGVNILWFEGEYPYLKQNFDLPESVKFYVLQNGSWVLLNAQLEGALRFSEMNHFSFPDVKTTAIRMDVTNYTGKASRAFSAYFDEEIAAGYFLRCRREEDGLHVFVDDKYMAAVQGDWEQSKVGMYTENLSATFNGIMHYQSGGVAVKTITIEPVVCIIGETVQLKVHVLPLNATNTQLKWESSNPSVVSVTDDGVITRHAAGNASISASASDGGNINETIEILETGIKENKGISAFVIFPNPTSNILHYAVSEQINEFTVYALSGEKLLSHIPDGSNQIYLKNLQTGMYLLQAKAENEMYTKRFTTIKN